MEIYQRLLTTTVPEVVVVGSEGLVDGIIGFIQKIIQKIIDGIKWIFSKIFSSSKESTIKATEEKMKNGTPKKSIAYTKPVMYAIADGMAGDTSKCNSHIVAYVGELEKTHTKIQDRMTKHSNQMQPGLLKALEKVTIKKIEEEFFLSHRSSVKVNFDPNSADHSNSIFKVTHGSRDFSKPEKITENLELREETCNKCFSVFGKLMAKRKLFQALFDKIHDAWAKDYTNLARSKEIAEIPDLKLRLETFRIEVSTITALAEMFDKEHEIFTALCQQMYETKGK
ncbi:hypothetical protein [Shewanella phage FishSpeaker]|nr:hypothetical protein [Shewanella phage FishSpeaker]